MEDKSKMELIRDFINNCYLFKDGKINVDYLKDDVYSYSVDRSPVEPQVKKYIDGNGGKYQINFDLAVQLPFSASAKNNLINSKFCEDYEKWIYEQNKKKNFPKIPGAFSIRCTAPGTILQKTDTTAIYVIQNTFTYYEFH